MESSYKDVLATLGSAECSQYLDEMSRIHAYTKHYLLLTEELSLDGAVLLQPLKEHRDAYDHLMRVFFLPHRDDMQSGNEQYIIENVKKALGHEYRAFFDMADWFTYMCRKYIREELSYAAKQRKYSKSYADFAEVKQFINALGPQIAQYREEKDVGNEQHMLKAVEQYKDTMDRLFALYQRVQAL